MEYMISRALIATMQSRAYVLVVPAVYHHQIREKLIKKANTSNTAVYSRSMMLDL